MSTNKYTKTKVSIRATAMIGIATALFAASAAHAIPITKIYTATNGSGTVTFTDLEPVNSLKIEIDNTSVSTDFGGGYENSSIITGLIFNVTGNIIATGPITFTDGSNPANDLSSAWEVVLNINSNISPGNTVFEVTFRTTNGANGGIYNAADPGTNLANAFPDIATLIIPITMPVQWSLETIDGSWLRMQRVGPNGSGSLKIPDDPRIPPEEIPEPGVLFLLGAGLLGLGMARCRKAS